MFPTVHGIVNQAGGAGGGGEPFDATWASLTTPAGASVNGVGTMGWSFTVSRPLKTSKGRVYSTSATSTTRAVGVWRVSDATQIAVTHNTNFTQAGWTEVPFNHDPVTLVPGETYIVATWRRATTTPRVGTHDTNITPWATIPEVSFIEGLTAADMNGDVMPATPTNIVRGVDLWLEEP